jgi:hypothetical protein
LFSRDADTPPEEAAPEEATPANAAAAAHEDADGVTDAERDALTFTAYDLDVHLTPVAAGIWVRAGLTVRNDGTVPLKRLALDISSSLRWDAISSVGEGLVAATPMTFAMHMLDTDADHTGQMDEAVVTLAQPTGSGGDDGVDGAVFGVDSAVGAAAGADWAHRRTRRSTRIGTRLRRASRMRRARAQRCAVLEM